MERMIPVDLNAERATLGSVLLERDQISLIATYLSADDFYLEKHGWVYEAMLACYLKRIPPDLTTVSAELRRHERLEPIGGLSFLGELSAAVPTAAHIEHYANIVKKAAIRRSMIEVAGKIAALGYKEWEDLAENLSQAQGLVFDLSIGSVQDDPLTVSHDADEFFSALAAMSERKDCLCGLATEFHKLDALTGGLQPSDLMVLASRPGVGKTSLALSIALNVAMNGKRVVFFSLEMARKQLFERLVSMQTLIPSHRLRNNKLTEEERHVIANVCGRLAPLPLLIDDSPQITVLDMLAKVRKASLFEHVDLVVVDYLQLIHTAMRGKGNRTQEVSDISRGLKLLAKELNIPVIALSQLNRGVESRQSKVPMLSDLRESGSIEQDADLVIFIYREELYDKETDLKGIAELHIAKHRNGPLGVVLLRFDAETTFFDNLGSDYYQDDEVFSTEEQ